MTKEEIEKMDEEQCTLLLLKFVELFPWLLKVADGGYHPKIVKREMMKAAVDAGAFD